MLVGGRDEISPSPSKGASGVLDRRGYRHTGLSPLQKIDGKPE
jgi:hypothetical protein